MLELAKLAKVKDIPVDTTIKIEKNKAIVTVKARKDCPECFGKGRMSYVATKEETKKQFGGGNIQAKNIKMTRWCGCVEAAARKEIMRLGLNWKITDINITLEE